MNRITDLLVQADILLTVIAILLFWMLILVAMIALSRRRG